MKIADGFAVREVAGKSVAIAVGGKAASLGGMIALNETGKLLFSLLTEGTTEEKMADALIAEYEIDRATAVADVAAFLAPLKDAKLIEE
ncbi:MAG: PqqD family protein [Clostridia bacterium]|nr:PqqD family protein [Clostridia bacterium]MBQ8268211.1 PqqD family protein [Clostridia bacterium]MBR2324553.1 PqqD family protein [Clostridia bacterium]